MKDKTIYLPGLNGLRSIAALSVLISHISLRGIANFGLPFIDFPMAGYGVTLFFVISGFLITYLLKQEILKQKNVDVKKFYLRRILRIWPIYYLFILICICTFFVLGKEHEIISEQLWFYVFFGANIPFVLQQGIMILVHYWSIGVEEQFYLFWPWIVRLTLDKLLKVSIVIFLFLFMTKILLWFYLGPSSYPYRFIMVTRFHCMMVGAIGAILFFDDKQWFLKLFSNKIAQAISWSLFLLIGFNFIHIPPVIGQEIVAVASLGMIFGQVIVKGQLFTLENQLCDFIGKISYGIYVIHPLVILLFSKFFRCMDIALSLKYTLVYSSVVFTTIFIAWLSYTYFEKPFLKLKNRFAVVQSTNSMSPIENNLVKPI